MNTERRQSGYIGEGQGFREISDALAYSKLIGEKFFECVHAYAVQLNLNPTSKMRMQNSFSLKLTLCLLKIFLTVVADELDAS